MQIMLEKLQVVSEPTHYDHHGHPLAAAASLRTQDPDHHISTSKTTFDNPNQDKTTLSLHSCKSLYKQTETNKLESLIRGELKIQGPQCSAKLLTT
jgi:hypothetical protein